MSRFSFELPAWINTRRSAILMFFGACLSAQGLSRQSSQEDEVPGNRKLKLPELNDDPRLPDGRSQKNAIAKEQHEKALDDADQLLALAKELRDELQKAGTYVVPLNSVKKTEEIEKLAKRIRGRLKS